MYPTEGVCCEAVGRAKGRVNPKTYRKWVHPFMEPLSDLEPYVVSFILFFYIASDWIFLILLWIWLENRYQSDKYNDCLLSVGDVDCQIPQQDSTVCSSYRYALKSALRYKIALCIQAGDMCWMNGIFPANFKFFLIFCHQSNLLTLRPPIYRIL